MWHTFHIHKTCSTSNSLRLAISYLCVLYPVVEFRGISVAISKHYQCTSMSIGQSLQVLLSTQPCEQSNWPIYCAISPKMAEILYGHCVCDTISCTTICGREKLCHNFLYARHTARNIFSSRVFMQSALRCKENNRIFSCKFLTIKSDIWKKNIQMLF